MSSTKTYTWAVKIMRTMKLSKTNQYEHEITFEQIHLFRKKNFMWKKILESIIMAI